MDEFELIARCFRGRTERRPDTVLGIGDDAALLDTGGRPLAQARATVAFTERDDPGRVACRAFGGALLRLAAQGSAPCWATLALTLEAGDAAWTRRFSDAAAAVCDASGVELIGGDTTRGPGRATVFALGLETSLPPRSAPQPHDAAVALKLSVPMNGAPEQAIAALVRVCTTLAGRGAVVHWHEVPDAGRRDAPGLELAVHTGAVGARALRTVASRHRLTLSAAGAED